MKKLMNIFFLSCLKASELIEKKMHFKISFKEKLQLKVHKMMCDACSAFEKQTVILEKGIELQQKRNPDNIDVEDLKRKINLAINNKEDQR